MSKDMDWFSRTMIKMKDKDLDGGQGLKSTYKDSVEGHGLVSTEKY